VRILLARLADEDGESRIVLPTRTILRRSCGCFGGEVLVASDANEGSATASFAAEIDGRREIVKAELARAAQGSFDSIAGWQGILIDAFAAQLATGGSRFTKTLRTVLRALAESGADLASVHDVITVMRSQMLRAVGQDRAAAARAEGIWQEARIIASEALERRQAHRRAESERLHDALIQMSRALGTLSTVGELEAVLGAHLRELGVRFFCVSLYRDRSDADGTSVPLVIHDPELAPGRHDLGDAFPSGQLLPAWALDVDPSRQLVVLSLHHAGEQLGLLTLSFDQRPCFSYETIAEMLSAALHKLRLELLLTKGPAPRGASPALLVELQLGSPFPRRRARVDDNASTPLQT